MTKRKQDGTITVVII